MARNSPDPDFPPEPAVASARAGDGGVTAVTRALQIMEAFRIGERHLTLAELSRRTGLHATTVLRLARTLARSGFMVQREEGEWRLGPAAGWLGARYQAGFDINNVVEPTLRALSYARATRPDVLEALTVNVDDLETRKLTLAWEDSDVSVPLKVVSSPYREVTGPVLDYVKRISKEAPRTVVTVFIPEYVVGHWWEGLLHNQSALRLKTRLLFMPNVMVTSVPWQLNSSDRVKQPEQQSAPGDVRRGFAE